MAMNGRQQNWVVKGVKQKIPRHLCRCHKKHTIQIAFLTILIFTVISIVSRYSSITTIIGPTGPRPFRHRSSLNHQPYMPWTRDVLKEAGQNTSKKLEILRNGYGVERRVTKQGVEVLWENGIYYMPFPYLESRNDMWYSSPVEPNIPFDENDFFLNDEERISKFRLLQKQEQQQQQQQQQEQQQTQQQEQQKAATATLTGPILNLSPRSNVGPRSDSRSTPMSRSRSRKIILWWQDKKWMEPQDGLNPLRMCPDFPCSITTNRKYTNESSALIINGQFVEDMFPPVVRPDQAMVFYQIEPITSHTVPFSHFVDKSWETRFNWTMSYRWDADIPVYHGLLRKRLQPPSGKNYQAIVAGKTRQAAWLVFNRGSSSRRDDYARELQRYMSVDISGEQFPDCPRLQDWECIKKINKNYKFYLAFENSFCDDYITEKFYKYFNLDVVVVARGINQYSDVAPPETFINTHDYKSPRDLANHLLYLDRNPDEYIKILKEKDKYLTIYEAYLVKRIDPIMLETRYEAVPFCHMCHRLWNLEVYRKEIPNISKWFYQSKCYAPDDLSFADTRSRWEFLSNYNQQQQQHQQFRQQQSNRRYAGAAHSSFLFGIHRPEAYVNKEASSSVLKKNAVSNGGGIFLQNRATVFGKESPSIYQDKGMALSRDSFLQRGAILNTFLKDNSVSQQSKSDGRSGQVQQTQEKDLSSQNLINVQSQNEQLKSGPESLKKVQYDSPTYSSSDYVKQRVQYESARLSRD